MNELQLHLCNKLVEGGFLPDDARQCIDIAEHAKAEALAAADRVTSAAPLDLQTQSLLLFTILMSVHMREAQQKVTELFAMFSQAGEHQQ